MTKYVLVRVEPGKPTVEESFDSLTEANLAKFVEEGKHPTAEFTVEVR